VGRLDVDSKGAILITNDGEFSNYVTHPRYDISKTYRVRITGQVDQSVLEKLRSGIWLSEGKTGSIDAKVIRTTKNDTILRLVIKEGKNRIIRRILAKLGFTVTELERTRIGTIALGKLKPGTYRELKPVEVKKLLPRKKVKSKTPAKGRSGPAKNKRPASTTGRQGGPPRKKKPTNARRTGRPPLKKKRGGSSGKRR